MDIARALAPEPAKLVIPAVLVALMLIVIWGFASLGAMLDAEVCGTQSSHLGAIKALDDSGVGPAFVIASGALAVMDPLFPLPCELLSPAPSSCRHYMKASTYTECLPRFGEAMEARFGNGQGPDLGRAMEPGSVPYRALSAADLALNGLVLAAEGYLVSAILLLALRPGRG